MKQNKIVSKNLYSDIKIILEKARERSYRTVNFLMVEAYWNIGRLIVEEEFNGKKRADYGSFLIKELSKKLTKDFGKGFSENNLWYMRQFYISFPIVHAVRGESSASIRHSMRDKSRAKENVNAVSSELHFSETAIGKAVRHTSVDLKSYLRPELSWTHYRILLKLEKEEARYFYMNEAANSNWSTRELERQINSLLFERLAELVNKNETKNYFN